MTKCARVCVFHKYNLNRTAYKKQSHLSHFSLFSLSYITTGSGWVPSALWFSTPLKATSTEAQYSKSIHFSPSLHPTKKAGHQDSCEALLSATIHHSCPDKFNGLVHSTHRYPVQLSKWGHVLLHLEFQKHTSLFSPIPKGTGLHGVCLHLNWWVLPKIEDKKLIPGIS